MAIVAVLTIARPNQGRPGFHVLGARLGWSSRSPAVTIAAPLLARMEGCYR